MDTDLGGWNAWVTGASGGIGRAIARALSKEGVGLALSGRSRIGELEALARAEGWGEGALFLGFDAADARASERAFGAARERFGRIDLLVACAGAWPPEDLLLHELPAARIESTVAVNLLGPTYALRAFQRGLVQDGPRADGRGAAAVLVGSTAARFGERGHADYALAKAGLYGLLQTAKNELVRVDPYARINLVEPGWTVTEMARPALADDGVVRRVARTMALRQLAAAEDVARAVLVLASPALSRHVTGQVLTVAGGMEGRVLWDDQDVDPERVRQRSADGRGQR